ncbi:ATP-binding protein [Bacteriovorax sp. PP10]|uniref:ATP-binding protein n=1 Tax=Bacteriovorax antarcticus TaxID=3088717 RepID=A0ABU5VYV6_9BACT|nr:ATP-binding protein [Bacteriovorax sp. PP10]MEA9358258.1 ATP-binding protein [Bacteriovorax sp. PP10]
MLTYLHDIRNKLTLISGHTAILSKKYGEEDFHAIRTNLIRINEIINDAYKFMQEGYEECKLSFTSIEFIRQMDLLTETISFLYPIEVINETRDYKPKSDFSIDFNINLVFQVIENAIDNSLKAKSTKLIIRLLETGNHCVFEIVDNGMEKKQTENSFEEISIIPHGIGKAIMNDNMKKVNGKIEWGRRIDNSGMIVRLYFPKKA